MNRKRVTALLIAEAVLCLWLAWAYGSGGDILAAALAFPFAAPGRALRWMSLAGTVGNMIAVALYALLCLIPVAVLLRRLRRGAHWEDALLAVMSLLLGYVLYLAVNPGLVSWLVGGPAVLGGVFYSVLAAYVLLRILRASLAAEGEQLLRCGGHLLTVLAAVCVFAAFCLCPAAFFAAVDGVRAANPGYESALGLTYCFLALQCAIGMGTYLLDIWVIAGAERLLTRWGEGPYSQGTVQAAGVLSLRCAVSLSAAVLASVAFHLLQLAFMSRLHTTSFSLNIPLASLALVIGTLLLAQYLREGKKLKDDNDLFI